MNTRKDTDPDTDSLFGRIFETVILFAVGCYLVKLGVCYLISVRVPLIIIAAIIGIIVITWRVYKWRNDHDSY